MILVLTLGIHEEGFFSGHLDETIRKEILERFRGCAYRVSPDNGVFRSNRIPSSNTTLVQTVVDLLNAGVNCLQPVKSLTELRRESSVCLCHVGEESVSTA